MNSKKNIMAIAAALGMLVTIFSSPARAKVSSLIASGSFTSAPDAVSGFDYTITVLNSSASTASINSFWYGWTLSGEFLPFQPTAAAGPAGWTATDFPSGSTPSSIEFQNAFGAGIAPGSSGAFTFKAPAADTPAVLNGNTSGPPSGPVGSSFAFSGNVVLSGAQSSFTVSEAPEPSSLAMLALGGICLARLAWTKKASRVA